LIRVGDDTHLWAESYDRVIDDIFDVQFEIAQSVTDHLGVVLAVSERKLVESQPTDNLEAYQAYLRGRYWATRPHFTYENWERAMAAYQQAAELDPDFALAQAHLARGHAMARYFRYDLTPERLEAADAAAARAVELAPNSPRVNLALGYYQLWAYRDVEKALEEFALAGADQPDNAEVLETKGNVFLLQGRWEEALDAFQRAFDLSPRDADLIVSTAGVLWTMRRYPEAFAATDQAINLAPDTLWPYLYKALTLWSWKGSATRTRAVLEALPGTAGGWKIWAWYWQEMYEQRYREALERLESTTEGWIRIKMFARPNSLFAAQAYELLGEPELARESYESAREFLEPEVLASPEDPRLRSSLGIVYAALGRKEDAIRESIRATELLPRSMDGFYYLPYVVDLAHIYTILGENEAALDQIEYLLSNPSWISAPFLRMDPRWDPLRDDPRFQALLKNYKIEQ
jgi:tetratricopeptide (TPR) repeat protein